MSASNQMPFWLALWRTGIGPRKFEALLKKFPAVSDIFGLKPDELSQIGLKENTIAALSQPDWPGVESDLRWAEQENHGILTWQDPAYPARLREISSAPPILFIKGDPLLLSRAQLAMVGSRNPTFQGAETAEQFAEQLAIAGLVITSGLALGIDAASHRGALSAKQPTLAVMGTGFDCIYPSRHQSLAEKIAEQGALISEFPQGTPLSPKHFPRRNRIISGLSVGVFVVEATLGSGSLITARFANEQGRDVFAMPGSIHNPLARGCHTLIREGAKLVETTTDILEELGNVLQWELRPTEPVAQNKAHSLDENYGKLFCAIDFAPTPMDVLIQRTGLTAESVSSMLLTLELQGLARAVVGGYSRTQRHTKP